MMKEKWIIPEVSEYDQKLMDLGYFMEIMENGDILYIRADVRSHKKIILKNGVVKATVSRLTLNDEVEIEPATLSCDEIEAIAGKCKEVYDE